MYLFVCQHPDGCENYIAEPTVIVAEDLGGGIRIHGAVICDGHDFPFEMQRVKVEIVNK